MTTIQKNEEIAKMLGWIWNNFFWSKRLHEGYIGKSDKLLFDLDFNWQFEAIDFLQKKHFNIIFAPFLDTDENVLSGEYWCQILEKDYVDISKGCIMAVTGCSSNKEAIFEALYLFSQYLKNLK